MITAERLRELLHYDPVSGRFTWRVSQGRSRAGSQAGSINGRGYRKVKLDGQQYLAHRLVWLYVHGYWPSQIDHKNCAQDDNRLSNLRVATPSQNGSNRRLHRNSTSMVKGVDWHKARSKWRANIMVNGHKIYLGSFPTKQLAAVAYREAAVQAFGDFARTEADE